MFSFTLISFASRFSCFVTLALTLEHFATSSWAEDIGDDTLIRVPRKILELLCVWYCLDRLRQDPKCVPFRLLPSRPLFPAFFHSSPRQVWFCVHICVSSFRCRFFDATVISHISGAVESNLAAKPLYHRYGMQLFRCARPRCCFVVSYC